MENKLKRVNNVLTLYKTDSSYGPEVKTKGKGLTGDEIDGNMLFLHGEAVGNVSFEDGSIVITRKDGAEFKAELPKVNDSKYELGDDGTITITNPSGEEVVLKGLFNENSLKLASDSPISGNGTKESPLHFNDGYISGDLGSVDYIFSSINGPLTEPEATTEKIVKWAKDNFKDMEGINDLSVENRILITQKAYICNKKITGVQYVLVSGNDRRVMKSGESVTLVSPDGLNFVKYVLSLDNFTPKLVETVNIIDPDDKILYSKEDNAAISSKIGLVRGRNDEGAAVLSLVGKKDEVISSVPIGDFMMNSFLETAKVENKDGKTMLVLCFKGVDEEGHENSQTVEIDLGTLINETQGELKKEMDDLKAEIEGMKEKYETDITKIRAAIECLEKSTVREIVGTGNQIKVVSSPVEGEGEKGIKATISFSDDAYFIAGE